jgi:hypothetical protein
MTGRGRVAVFTIVGLAVVCVGQAFMLMTIEPSSSPDDPGEPSRLDIASIDLATGGRDGTLSARDMVPGDVVSGAVTVANSGNRPLTYAMSQTVAPADGADLAAALNVTIKAIGSSCADFDGAILYDGPLDEAAIGSEASGRSLPAATAQILCFRVELPIESDDALQQTATMVTLSFRTSRQAAVP